MSAYQEKNLSVIAYANGFTLWQYDGKKQSIKELTAPGFFNPVYALMNHGDMVILTARETSKICTVKNRADKNGNPCVQLQDLGR